MQNYGPALSMYEITRLKIEDISKLVEKINSEGLLRGFEQKDFETDIQSQNVILLHYSQSAFCQFQFTQEESDLIEIWCSPELRRKGIARSLLLAGIKELKSNDVKNCFLEVAIDNIGAIALYRGLGFNEIGKRKAYYPRENGIFIDALTMKLEIDSMTHLQK